MIEINSHVVNIRDDEAGINLTHIDNSEDFSQSTDSELVDLINSICEEREFSESDL